MKTLILILFLTSLTFGQSNLLLLMSDDASPYLDETNTYLARVEADGGEVIYIDTVDVMMRALQDSSIYTSCKSFVNPNFGVKKDANNKVTKLYSLIGTADFVQADTSKAYTWVATGGHNNTAYMLGDDVNDYMYMQPSCLTSGSDFTVNMRFYQIAPDVGDRYFAINHSTGAASGMNLAYNGAVQILWDGAAWGTGGWAYTQNNWGFLSLTRDGNVASLYANGSASTSSTIDAAPIEGTTGIMMGSAGNTPGTYFGGRVEDFSVFNVILTNSQINIIYSK